MFILIYRNPKYNILLLSSGTKLFITFEFKGFSTWGVRDTIFLCWLLLHRQLSTQPTRGARSAQSRLASPSSESQPSSSEAGTQPTAFSQISVHASGAWRHPNTLIPIPIWDFYFDISEWHILSALAWTPALMLHLTNPCAKWKVLCLTKPKCKINKTKSLGNYITYIVLTPLGKVCIQLFFFYGWIVGKAGLFNLGKAACLGKGKFIIQTWESQYKNNLMSHSACMG